MSAPARRTPVLALLLAACAAGPQVVSAPPPAPEAPPAPAVLALPASTRPGVSLQLRFRTGAVDDPPGQAGLTALTARLMVEGGAGPLDARALLQALYPIAAELEVRVDEEQTTFLARVHRDALDRLVPIVGDVLVRPRWDEKEFQRLRDAAVNDVEKRLRQGDDENLGKFALQALLYRGHPYGRLPRGHVSELKGLTLEQVKAHAARVFTRDRLTIGVAGGYPAELPDRLLTSMGALPARGAPAVVVPVQKAPARPHYLLVEKRATATAVSMGFPWELSRASPDWPAMSVAGSALGEHRQFNGRLMQRLREARGLNYGDYAYLEHFEQEGGNAATAQLGRGRHQQDFTVWLRPVQNENRLFAVRAALREVQRTLGEEPFGEEEVARTRGFLQGYLLLFAQTDARRLGHALDGAFAGPPDHLARWRAGLPEVTAAAVNAAWRRWAGPGRLQVVLVGPDMAAVKQALLSGAPTPIVYQDPTVKRSEAQLAADAEIARFPFGAVGEEDVEVVPVEKLFE